jgi:hypothetical protein
MRFLAAAILATTAATAARADVVDSFNRANALTPGDVYTVQNGNIRIDGNRAITTNVVSLATYNNSASDSAAIDVALRGAESGSYVALSFGFDSSASYFIKVQDNDGDGFFDRYRFDTGNNDLTGPIQTLNSFQSGSIAVGIVGSVATLTVTANGGTQTFSYDYGFVTGSATVGFGLNRFGVADNFSFDGLANAPVPEPATWALMIGGFGLAGAAARSRRRGVVAA